MQITKRKTTVTGGIYHGEKYGWHYYFGHALSGKFFSRHQAEKALKAQFDQATEQFGKNWEVAINRKDLDN